MIERMGDDPVGRTRRHYRRHGRSARACESCVSVNIGIFVPAKEQCCMIEGIVWASGLRQVSAMQGS